MHNWGDDWFEKNGNDLYRAINYCMTNWLRWGRIGSHGKEKYGTFRHHVYFWDGTIHGLIWPGYVSIQNRWLYFKFDWYITRPLVTKTGIIKLVHMYQNMVYTKVLDKACKKWPNVKEEIK